MLRPWDFKILIRRASKAAVFLQIAHAIIDEIKRGRLAPGTALPGSRELAESLEINRKTVIQAYAELEAQGWVTSEKTRGTFVSAHLPEIAQSAKESRRGRIPERPDFRLVGAAPNIPLILPEKNMLVFDDGAPDTRLIPLDALARAYRNALGQAGRGRLGYGDPRGTAGLRAAISGMLNMDRGLITTPDNICLTRGSQMAIYIAARILAGPGDTVVMEELSYPPAREAFRFAGAEVVPVPLDAQGMRVDELENICRKKRVRAVYVTPHHQFPTTVLMKPDRRMRLLSLAAQFGFAIVEDDYDHEFHFVHQPMLPLASADMSGKVVYIGSLSKILSPSLRLGYLVGPKSFIDRAASEIMMIDRQGDPATEGAVNELIESGELHRHTRKVMKLYGERREHFAGLLKSLFGRRVEFTVPDGGLAFWVQFKDTDLDLLAAFGIKHGVAILPARAFTTTPRPVHAARLGFASLDMTELKRATQRLRTALDDGKP
ncbi:MAG TPA: PLP-dependent aminotransferase family protein [Rhizomicrobium sp.]|jgi:GntR family transcriptional regulator/MocR family aminotransferase|nr:PLP-dependent aminotransferase family protein [Rhizomicrobium sp.]